MCTTSMVGDHYSEKYRDHFNLPGINWTGALPAVYVQKHEFDALKREVEDMKKLLLRAKDYDERNGEPHCEMDEKVALLKRVAELVGVNLDEVFAHSDKTQAE